MSAVPAERIRDPEDLHVPARMREILDALTDEGAQQFVEEMVGAGEKASATGDLRPINEVFEAWYRTLLLVRMPHFREEWDRDISEDQLHTSDQLSERLKLA